MPAQACSAHSFSPSVRSRSGKRWTSGLQKWSRTNSGVPLGLRSYDAYACAPELRRVSQLDFQDASGLSMMARIAFKSGKSLQGEEASEAVERGLQALRLLNTEYAAQLSVMREMRRDKANREGVAHELGTVFLHKKYGYRGLIYGWDRTCTRGGDWVKEAGVEPNQAFYYVLPSEDDCIRLFKQPLSTRYVAQDNILPLPGERIVHRALTHYFSGHSPSLGRYIPSAKLQFEYPGAYTPEAALDRSAVAADSNLLLHSEEDEEGRARGSGSGRGGYKRVDRSKAVYEEEREAVI